MVLGKLLKLENHILPSLSIKFLFIFSTILKCSRFLTIINGLWKDTLYKIIRVTDGDTSTLMRQKAKETQVSDS